MSEEILSSDIGQIAIPVGLGLASAATPGGARGVSGLLGSAALVQDVNRRNRLRQALQTQLGGVGAGQTQAPALPAPSPAQAPTPLAQATPGPPGVTMPATAPSVPATAAAAPTAPAASAGQPSAPQTPFTTIAQLPLATRRLIASLPPEQASAALTRVLTTPRSEPKGRVFRDEKTGEILSVEGGQVRTLRKPRGRRRIGDIFAEAPPGTEVTVEPERGVRITRKAPTPAKPLTEQQKTVDSIYRRLNAGKITKLSDLNELERTALSVTLSNRRPDITRGDVASIRARAFQIASQELRTNVRLTRDPAKMADAVNKRASELTLLILQDLMQDQRKSLDEALNTQEDPLGLRTP